MWFASIMHLKLILTEMQHNKRSRKCSSHLWLPTWTASPEGQQAVVLASDFTHSKIIMYCTDDSVLKHYFWCRNYPMK